MLRALAEKPSLQPREKLCYNAAREADLQAGRCENPTLVDREALWL